MNNLLIKRIKKQVALQFENLTGKKTDEDLLEAIEEQLGPIDDKQYVELRRMAILGEISKQRRLYSIEKCDADQGDLFGGGILDKVLNIVEDAKRFVLRYKEANWTHIIHHRENQIGNLRKANFSFEKSERRREVLKPIMEKDPELNVEQALIKLEDAKEQPAKKKRHKKG